MEEFRLILIGLPIGFFMSFALGPVFFSIINSVLSGGFKTVIPISLGVIFADIVIISLILFGFRFLDTDFISANSSLFHFINFVILLLFGLFILFKNKKEPTISVQRTYSGFFSGFALNFFNPANFFIWIAFSNFAHQNHHTNALFVYLGCLMGILLTELGIGFFASALKKFLSIKNIYYVNMISGLAFICFSIYFFIKWLFF